MMPILSLALLIALGACAMPPGRLDEAPPTEIDAALKAPPPKVGAKTADSLDTTSAEQRDAAARMAAENGGTLLGKTIASLGNPTKPGFWIETPLVTSPGQGRVEFPGSGKSVAVELIPIEGAPGAGSRLSLPAMRLIEAPLTGLPEVLVYGS